MIWGFPGGADGYGLERFDITHLNSSLLLMGLPLDTPPLYWPAVRERHALLTEVIGVNASNIWDFDTGRIQLYNMKGEKYLHNESIDRKLPLMYMVCITVHALFVATLFYA